MKTKPHVHKAQFYETDGMGIIHHSNYIRWFEEARVDFMDQIGYGYERVNDAGIDFLVTEVKCQYKSMVRFGDTVHIYASITELTPAKMTISYRIVDAESDALRTTGESHHYIYHRERKRLISLQKEIPELFALLLDCLENPS